MTATRPTRRPGLTLTEALIAMFVAAIGLLALLVLFPLGAMQMGQSLKDERTAQVAAQADQLMRYYWRHEVQRDGRIPGFPDGPDPLVFAFTRPNMNGFEIYPGTTPPMNPDNFQIRASDRPNLAGSPPIYLSVYSSRYRRPLNAVGATPPLAPEPATNDPNFRWPSFPVVIDPLGWHPREGRAYSQLWVGGRDNAYLTANGYGQDALPLPLPRRTLRTFLNLTAGAYKPADSPPSNTPPLCATPPWQNVITAAFMYGQDGAPPVPFRSPLRFCTLLDDLTYGEDGSGVPPTNTTGTGVERQGRYNWMAILQQPHVNDPTTANLTVVVYDGRAPGYAPDGQELMYPRDSGFVTGNTPTASTLPHMVVFVPGSTALRVYYNGERPPISKGRWVMDGTLGGFPVIAPGPVGANAALAYDPDDTRFVGIVSPVTQRALRHANFYRVASATDGVDAARGGLTYLDIELEKPIKPRSDGLVVSDLTGSLRGERPATIDWTYYSGTLYVLPGVSEVFEMPPLTR
jgi:hypothetical protein